MFVVPLSQNSIRLEYKVYRVCFVFSKIIASQPRFFVASTERMCQTLWAQISLIVLLFRPKQQESQVTAITKTPKNPKHQTQNPKHKTKTNKALNPKPSAKKPKS